MELWAYKGLCYNHDNFILLSTTNKMQRIQDSLLLSMLYMFRAVSPPIIRSSKTVRNIWYVPGLLAASGGSKQARHVPYAACTVLELLRMGGETARNM
jgi:hypothetical protein